MQNNILYYCIIVFITQIIFAASRIWNIQCIATNNIKHAIISGFVVQIVWLITIAIGSVSMYDIIANWQLDYLPVVITFLFSGALGTWITMKFRK